MPYRLLFVCSQDDDDEIAACSEAGDVLVVEWPAGAGDYARKINAGYRATTEPFIFTGADDLVFHEGWAREALELASETGAGVVGTDDLWNPAVRRGDHSTHSLIRRAYVEQDGASWDGPGVVYHEGYDHQFVDTELVAVAMQRGRWAFCRAARVEHLHPFAHKGEMDATYRKGLAHGRDDRRLYESRRRLYLSE